MYRFCIRLGLNTIRNLSFGWKIKYFPPKSLTYKRRLTFLLLTSFIDLQLRYFRGEVTEIRRNLLLHAWRKNSSFRCSIQRLLCQSRSEDSKDDIFLILTRMERGTPIQKTRALCVFLCYSSLNSAQRIGHYSLLHIWNQSCKTNYTTGISHQSN